MNEVKTIYKKLLAVQGEIGIVAKDKENPFFKSNYADINNYLEVVKPVLTKHGLVLNQPIKCQLDKNFIVTQITDSESGEQIESSIALPGNNDPQKYGAIITYFRRYGLVSLLALQAEDTDANDTKEDVKTVTYNKPERTTDGNREIPACSICKEPMKPTKPGSKTPFYCKHGNIWGKPVFSEEEISRKEQEFLDNLGVEVE